MGVIDPFPSFSHLTQTQLGQLFGVTAHVVGRWLKELGLRMPDGRPTPQVVASGEAQQCSPAGMSTFWVWEKRRIVDRFETAGHRRVQTADEQPTPPPPLHASGQCGVSETAVLPSIFSRPLNNGKFEIVWPDRVVRAWVDGEMLAQQVARVLSLALRVGKLRGGT